MLAATPQNMTTEGNKMIRTMWRGVLATGVLIGMIGAAGAQETRLVFATTMSAASADWRPAAEPKW